MFYSLNKCLNIFQGVQFVSLKWLEIQVTESVVGLWILGIWGSSIVSAAGMVENQNKGKGSTTKVLRDLMALLRLSRIQVLLQTLEKVHPVILLHKNNNKRPTINQRHHWSHSELWVKKKMAKYLNKLCVKQFQWLVIQEWSLVESHSPNNSEEILQEVCVPKLIQFMWRRYAWRNKWWRVPERM